MTFITGDVIAVEGEEHPFKVVFKHRDTIIAEWLVESVEDGQAEMLEAIKSLTDDDEDDEHDDDSEGNDEK